MEDKKFELFYDVMKEMDKAYDLMVEYDSYRTIMEIMYYIKSNRI